MNGTTVREHSLQGRGTEGDLFRWQPFCYAVYDWQSVQGEAVHQEAPSARENQRVAGVGVEADALGGPEMYEEECTNCWYEETEGCCVRIWSVEES